MFLQLNQLITNKAKVATRLRVERHIYVLDLQIKKSTFVFDGIAREVDGLQGGGVVLPQRCCHFDRKVPAAEQPGYFSMIPCERL